MSNRHQGDRGDPDSREEILIGRVLDGLAEEAEWCELESMAIRDREVWERLARSAHAEAGLRGDLDRALEVAERCPLPLQPWSPRRRWRPLVLLTWSGWAAALLAIALLLFDGMHRDRTTTLERTPLPVRTMSAEDAYEHYLKLGQEQGLIMGVLPRQVMSTRIAPDGKGVDVIYLRRLVERTHIPQLYETGRNDQGESISLPVSPERLAGYKGF